MRRLLPGLALALSLIVASAAGAQTLSPRGVPWQSSGGKFMPGEKLYLNTANPLVQGLSLLFVFNSNYGIAYPFYIARGAAPLNSASGGVSTMTASGMALTAESTSPAGGSYSHSGVTYTMPTTQGSVFVFGQANWVADGAWHSLLEINTNGAVPEFAFFKYTSDKLYCGWNTDNGANDHRANVSISGLWNAADPLVAGCGWDATSTILYIQGIAQNTNSGAPTTFSTAGLDFCIGCYWNGGAIGDYFSSAAFKDGIHYLAVWDRKLSPIEALSLAQKPMQLFTTQTDILLTMMSSPPVVVPGSGHLFWPGLPF